MKIKKLTLGILIMILSLAVIFAGCGQKNSSSSNESNAPAENKTQQAVEPIVFGVATALGSSEGAYALRTAQLAAEEVNAAGGVEVGGVKRPLKIEYIDTREGEPGLPITEAMASLEKLILEKKPVAFAVGGFRSEVFLAYMDLIAKYKIPFITSVVLTSDFEKKMETDPQKYKYIFRSGLNVQGLVEMLTKTMGFIGEELNIKKIYFINEDVLWANGTNAVLENWAKANGWDVIGKDAYPTGSTDFSTSLNKAKVGGAQLIVTIFDMPQAGILIKQIKTMKVPAMVAGYISPASSANGWKAYDGGIEGIINVNFELGSIAAEAVPKSIEFHKNFAKKYGQETLNNMPGHAPGPSYDNVYILADAIKQAGSLSGDALVDAIEKTDMNGLIGRIRFNKNHQVVFGEDPAESAVYLAFQWRAPGKRVLVFPTTLAEGKIEIPSYMK